MRSRRSPVAAAALGRRAAPPPRALAGSRAAGRGRRAAPRRRRGPGRGGRARRARAPAPAVGSTSTIAPGARARAAAEASPARRARTAARRRGTVRARRDDGARGRRSTRSGITSPRAAPSRPRRGRARAPRRRRRGRPRRATSGLTPLPRIEVPSAVRYSPTVRSSAPPASQVDHLLEDALAVGARADDGGEVVLLERGGDDLGGRGGVAVDRARRSAMALERVAGRVVASCPGVRPSVVTIGAVLDEDRCRPARPRRAGRRRCRAGRRRGPRPPSAPASRSRRAARRGAPAVNVARRT